MKNSFYGTIVLCVLIIFCVACGRNDKEQELEYENNVQDVQKENGTEEEEYSEQEDSGDTNTGIENDNFSQEQEEVIEEVPSRMEILFEISVGTEMGEIGYKDTLERMRGPESFIVNGKDIYILDTINRRILIYEGETLAGSLGVCAGAQEFVVYKNNFFVLDNDKTIYEYNPEGIIISENILPGNRDYSDVNSMRVNEGRKAVVDFDDSTAFVLDDGKFVWAEEERISVKSEEETTVIKYNGLCWSLTNNNDAIKCLGFDEENNCYILRMSLISDSVSQFAYQIEKYDVDGELIGWADIDRTDWVLISRKWIHITPEGGIFIMACLEDKVVGIQVFLGNMD